MAKKTESTAVNDLLNLMATEGARVMDPSADLFAEPPRKMPKGASGMFAMTAPPPPSKATRMSGKVAAVQAAGAVEPLPRQRAPHGTQSNTIPAPSRMSTIVPSRENTIPALEAAPPAPGMNVRASRPALPPPPRTQSGHSLPAPSRTSTPPAPPPARLSGQHAVPPVPPPARLSGQHAMPPVPPPARLSGQFAVPPAPPMPRTPTQSLAAQPVPPALADFEIDLDAAPMTAKPVPAPMPVAASVPVGAPLPVDMTAGSAWFADSRAVAMQTPFENTSKVHASRSATRDLMKKLALPTVAMIVLGGAIGGYIAISRKPAPTVAMTSVPAPATEAVAAPAVQKVVEQKVVEQKIETSAPVETAAPVEQKIAAPVEQKIETPAPSKQALVDVRIDSTPSGAEVTLVDHGKTTFLGSTPISASVDPSKTYEVMLSYPNKPSKMEKLDPKTTQHLAVSFGKGAPIAETAKPAPAMKHVEATTPKTEVASAKPAKVEKTEPKAEKSEPKAEAASEGGEGVLMLGSKPPCEIWVDGKDTGLMTPQRAMKLPVGKHSIKLASPDGEHNKMLSIDIKADKPTKVIEDLLGL
ncbi:MAG TPA: PEGA domain-containing protein [Kofleriaceae bacterium]|jgi:hypothetical protein